MGEGFPAFGQNYRVAYSSLLALSTTVIFASSALRINKHVVSEGYPSYYFHTGGVVFLTLAILLTMVSMFYGLSKEVQEGNSTDSLDQRAINFKKFKTLKLAGTVCAMGIIFTIIFVTTL